MKLMGDDIAHADHVYHLDLPDHVTLERTKQRALQRGSNLEEDIGQYHWVSGGMKRNLQDIRDRAPMTSVREPEHIERALVKKAQQILSKLQPSKEHQEFLDSHFTDTSTSKWKAFKNKLVSTKFVDAVKQDERADSKLKRYSENNARHMQAKGTPSYQVPSQSSGRSYKVKYHPSIKRFSCNCGDWVHKQSTKGKGGECKHVKMVKRELQAQGISKEKQAALRGFAAATILEGILEG
jgi:hypothetical protein